MDEFLRIYAFRHLESEQNKDRTGDVDSQLAGRGLAVLEQYITVQQQIIGDIDIVITGNKKRHLETLNHATQAWNYQGDVQQDERLNAPCVGPLIEQDPAITILQHDLERFKPTNGQLYEGKEGSFDPGKLGIWDYDRLYCAAFFNAKYRGIVFPDDETLPTFETLTENTIGFQENVLANVRERNLPTTAVIIGSCSCNGWMNEYARMKTVGINTHEPKDGDTAPFVQQHNQIQVYKMTRDQVFGEKAFRATHTNVPITEYLQTI